MSEIRQKNLSVTANLIRLVRNGDELLLANSYDLNPLYVREGGHYITQFLDAVSELGTIQKIGRTFPRDTELLGLLMAHRIIVPEGTKDGFPSFSTSRKVTDCERPRSTALYLLLSQSCNLGCVYCLNGQESYKKDENLMMPESVAFCAVDRFFEELAPGGTLQVIFFGGEPLLNWELAKKIIVHCEGVLKPKHPDKKFHYHLTSNLARLPDDLVQWAADHEIGFLCDVDGPPDIHDRLRPFRGGRPSHNAIVANIGRLAGAGLKVAMRATLTATNQHRMSEIAAHHKEIGGIASAFVPVNPVNSDEVILDSGLLPDPATIIRGLETVYGDGTWEPHSIFPFSTFSEKIRPHARIVMGCGAPYGNTPVVGVNGDVYPCIYLVGIKRFFLGNIMTDDYPRREVLDWMMEFLHVDNREECRSCAWRYLCGGGCPVGKLTVFENPRATEHIVEYTRKISCDYTKKILELLLWGRADGAASSVDRDTGEGEAVAIDDTIFC